MEFKLFGKSISIGEMQNADKSKPKASGVKNRIQQTQLVRSRQDIKTWRDALQIAESSIFPQRQNLLRIYKDVVLDPHLTAVMQQRANKVLSRGFKIIDASGELDEEKTDLLKTKWFNDFLSLSLDKTNYGYSLIEFGSLVNDEFEKVDIVPREYVVPERNAVRLSLGGGKEINYSRPPFSQWVIFVGDEKDLGLLNKATPIVLWKRLVQATWAEYNELYGVPLRIGKTDTKDVTARNNMEDMLTNLGSSAWGLFDEDDNIEIVNGVKAGGEGTFKNFIDLADQQISKLYLGQTMTTDDGASRSQAEVHSNTMESFTGQDLRWLSYVVNKQLLPFITLKGLSFEGFKFEWDLSEKLTLEQQFAIDKELLNSYKIPAQYIKATYGTPVEEVEIETPQPSNGVTIMNDVASLYKDFFKHGDGCTCGNC